MKVLYSWAVNDAANLMTVSCLPCLGIATEVSIRSDGLIRNGWQILERHAPVSPTNIDNNAIDDLELRLLVVCGADSHGWIIASRSAASLSAGLRH